MKASRNPDSSDTYGWVAIVGTTDLRVSALGVWDKDQDGLPAAHPVGIRSGEGTLLALAPIPAQMTASLVGPLRMQASPEDLSLAAGT